MLLICHHCSPSLSIDTALVGPGAQDAFAISGDADGGDQRDDWTGTVLTVDGNLVTIFLTDVTGLETSDHIRAVSTEVQDVFGHDVADQTGASMYRSC